MTSTTTNCAYICTPHEQVHGPIPQLHKADIVLIRHKKSFLRKLLRKMTNSYWDHSAMIIYARFQSKRRHHSILIESIRPGIFSLLSAKGTALHRLKKYLMDPDKYEVGIKRAPKFSDESRDRVRLFMLMNVDAPYWPWRYSHIILAAYLPFFGKIIMKHQRFSCSSLIQKAYFDAMPIDDKKRVVFKEGTWSPIELEELTNPGDLAKSSNSIWVYNEH